ncbi:MAG: hypothetical protein R3C49_09805 [Planctomycetaceae bacterium]
MNRHCLHHRLRQMVAVICMCPLLSVCNTATAQDAEHSSLREGETVYRIQSRSDGSVHKHQGVNQSDSQLERPDHLTFRSAVAAKLKSVPDAGRADTPAEFTPGNNPSGSSATRPELSSLRQEADTGIRSLDRGSVRRVSGEKASLLPIVSSGSSVAEPQQDISGETHEQVSLIQFIEILQWTVVVLLVAVLGVLGLKKWHSGSVLPMPAAQMKHLATLPVRNQFQAHLLQVGNTQFLITTDRTGVKTVSEITQWDTVDSSEQTSDEEPVSELSFQKTFGAVRERREVLSSRMNVKSQSESPAA